MIQMSISGKWHNGPNKRSNSRIEQWWMKWFKERTKTEKET
jgi:hypothetical protein